MVTASTAQNVHVSIQLIIGKIPTGKRFVAQISGKYECRLSACIFSVSKLFVRNNRWICSTGFPLSVSKVSSSAFHGASQLNMAKNDEPRKLLMVAMRVWKNKGVQYYSS